MLIHKMKYVEYVSFSFLGNDYDNIRKGAQTLDIKCGDIKNMMSRIKKDYDDMQEKLHEPELDEKKMRINKKNRWVW